jgi:hypothetical protein
MKSLDEQAADTGRVAEMPIRRELLCIVSLEHNSESFVEKRPNGFFSHSKVFIIDIQTLAHFVPRTFVSDFQKQQTSQLIILNHGGRVALPCIASRLLQSEHPHGVSFNPLSKNPLRSMQIG